MLFRSGLTECKVAVPSMSRNFEGSKPAECCPYNQLTLSTSTPMNVILHIASYSTPTALLAVGLAPTLLPTTFKPLAIVFSGLFSAVVPHLYPAPNNDDLFTLFHWIIWSFSCCWLVALREWSEILLNINLTGYRLAFADVFVLLDNPSWTIILLTLTTIMFLGAIFQRIIGHNDNKLGIFGKLVRAIKCVSLGCCVFVKGVHESAMEGLSQCSCSDARDGDEVSMTSSPPCYTVSPHYISKQLLLISHFARLLVLTKHLHATTGNLILWFDLRVMYTFTAVQ